MQRFAGHVPILPALFLLASCSRPAPDTRDAEAQVIHNLELTYSRDLSTHTVASVVSHLADGGWLILPGRPAAVGATAARVLLQEFWTDQKASLRLDPARVEVYRGVQHAISQGSYAMTLTDPRTKEIVQDRGRYMFVYQKQEDGSWKSSLDAFYSDLPWLPVHAPAPEPSESK